MFKKSKSMLLLLMMAFALPLLVACNSEKDTAAEESAQQEAKEEMKTLDNLMEAYNGESNAAAKYDEYAKIADQEGYLKIASLFRAASRAEAIHADNHAKVIKAMGGEPKADIKIPDKINTKDNLLDAINGETYERDSMYPDFIKIAQNEKNSDAVRTFNFAVAAEKEHAALFAEALSDMDNWKIEKQNFLVCPVCGYTVIQSEFEKCPVCFTLHEEFVVIN